MAKNNNKSDTESEEEEIVQVDADLPNEQWLPVPDETEQQDIKPRKKVKAKLSKSN
jgi:hypothetical protein